MTSCPWIPSISPEEARARRAKARRQGRLPGEVSKSELEESHFPLHGGLPPLRLLTDPQQLLGGGTGAGLWHAASVLVRYTAAMDSELWLNKSVLELGAGLGVCGLAVGRQHSPASVLLTDLPAQLPLLDRNVGNNCTGNIGTKLSTADLAFGQPLSSTIKLQCPFDIVIGSDIVYEESSSASCLSELVLDTLAQVCSPRSVVYLSLPHRSDGGQHDELEPLGTEEDVGARGLSSQFIQRARRQGWHVEELHREHKDKALLPYDIAVYRMQAAASVAHVDPLSTDGAVCLSAMD